MSYTISGMMTNPDEINSLFAPPAIEDEAPNNSPSESGEEETPPKDTEDTDVTEEPVTAENLFEDDDEQEPEKVGNAEDNLEKEERTPQKMSGSSPEKLYSSIANSLAEEGALSNLSEDDLKEVKDSESLIAAMKKQLDSMLDDDQRRIKSALNAGVQPSLIQQYENAIDYLDNLTDDQITAEDETGENLRRALIYQYQLNLGLSEEKAKRMVERTFQGGTDIEDAREAVDSLKEFYQDSYRKQIEYGKHKVQEERQRQEEAVKSFKNTLLKDQKILGDIEVDEKTRKLAFENWAKPTYKTKDGVYQSEIQKYISENPADFQMKVALLYTMTDGFTKMGNVLKQTVKKEKKKAMQELENVVNNTQRTSSGALNLFGNDANASFNGLDLAPISAWKK